MEDLITKEILKQKGWAVIPANKSNVVSELGPVIYRAEIKPKINARAKYATTHEMELHTDHPRARWISWECIRQTSQGGYSLLKDSYEALKTFSIDEKRELENILVNTHKVFPDDSCKYPILRKDVDESDWLYFTPWMIGEITSPLFNKLKSALDNIPIISVKLYPGEILVVNNGRMLHGRTAISGDQNRLLIRNWIGSPFDNFCSLK
ncbi:MAG: TauD/TfdA family dioxygenase [Bacteroidota bacterium]